MNELITRSLKTEDIQYLMDFPGPLMDEHEVEIVEWIVRYTGEYLKPPTLERLEKAFDTFVPVSTSSPLGDIFGLTVLDKKRRITSGQISELSAKISEDSQFDPTEDVSGLFESVAAPTGKLIKFSTFDRSRYFYKSKSPLKFNMPLIDRSTGGMVYGDLVYFVGRLGTGKTTLTQWIVHSWWQSERIVLVISNELMPADVMIKQDAMVGKFNPLDIRLGRSDDVIKRKIRVVKHIAAHSKGEIIVPQNRAMSPSDVYGLGNQLNVDAILIDGVHLMKIDKGYGSRWERTMKVTNRLKQLALETGIPCLGVTQLNRGAVGRKARMEDIAYSDALGQDADIVIGLTPDKKITRTLPSGVMQAEVEVIKNRFGKSLVGTSVKVDFNTMTITDSMAPRL